MFEEKKQSCLLIKKSTNTPFIVWNLLFGMLFKKTILNMCAGCDKFQDEDFFERSSFYKKRENCFL